MNKQLVFGGAYQARWAWVRETDPAILVSILDAGIAETATVHLNGYDHLWHEVRSAARHIVAEGGGHPYFT